MVPGFFFMPYNISTVIYYARYNANSNAEMRYLTHDSVTQRRYVLESIIGESYRKI